MSPAAGLFTSVVIYSVILLFAIVLMRYFWGVSLDSARNQCSCRQIKSLSLRINAEQLKSLSLSLISLLILHL